MKVKFGKTGIHFKIDVFAAVVVVVVVDAKAPNCVSVCMSLYPCVIGSASSLTGISFTTTVIKYVLL